jgi:hypothetical protein
LGFLRHTAIVSASSTRLDALTMAANPHAFGCR